MIARLLITFTKLCEISRPHFVGADSGSLFAAGDDDPVAP